MSETLLLFDIDGTLVNSERIILAAQVEAFAALGLPIPTREQSLSVVGLSLPEAFTVLVGPEGPVQALVEGYSPIFRRLRLSGEIPEPLFDSAGEIVARYAGEDAFLLGIATGKSRRGVEALLDKHGWHGHFATTQCADDAPSKPHPAMIQQACAAVALPPERAIMIGDSSYDMLMARSAGARAIGVSWGFQPVAALEAAGAEVIAQDFDHLAELIDLFSR